MPLILLYFVALTLIAVFLLYFAGVGVGRAFSHHTRPAVQAGLLGAIVGAVIGANLGVLMAAGALSLDVPAEEIHLKRVAAIVAFGGACAGYCGGVTGNRKP